MREIAQLEIPHLEANISLLGTIGYVAPLLGLLGTVTGMIEAFVQINRTSGTASVGDLSQGIYTALITTAAGLVVAIPCYLAHNFLVAQVHGIVADMERAGIETIHTLTDLPRKDMIAVALQPARRQKGVGPADGIGLQQETLPSQDRHVRRASVQTDVATDGLRNLLDGRTLRRRTDCRQPDGVVPLDCSSRRRRRGG